MNVTKFEYNLRNLKDYEKQLKTTKIRHSKNVYNYKCFCGKIDVGAQTRKSGIAKFEYNLENIKDYENDVVQPKKAHSKNAYN